MLDEVDPIDKVWAKIADSGHSYFPVYSKDPGTILGIVHVKSLWAQIAAGRKATLRSLLAPPLFVPETMSALRLLEKFKQTKNHIGLVLDEHGGIEGLVSITDVLKGVVGELPILGEEVEPEVVRREDGSWLLDGGMSASDLKGLLKVNKLPREDGSYTTVGGLMMTRLGRIPRTGDAFKWRGYRFEVVDMDRHRVDKVLISLLPKAPAPVKGAPA
jgi:putative hemolysin